MNRIKAYFRTKTAEQVFSACLLATCVIVMVLCVIARLCGILWFTADPSLIKEPNRVWQEIIMGLLMVFELTFIYKLLCRTNWFICIIISIIQTLICTGINCLVELVFNNCIDGNTVVQIFNIVCYFIIPLLFVRNWFSLIDSFILYGLQLLYSILFMVGRIGGLESSNFNFIVSMLSTIDYKLFIVSIYLFINYFGGIKLWKNQKRLILQKDLKK